MATVPIPDQRPIQSSLPGRWRLSSSLVRVIAELLPVALHDTGQYANNRVEADHGRLEARLLPMRGLEPDRRAAVVMQGHAFIQNLRRGHYELGI